METISIILSLSDNQDAHMMLSVFKDDKLNKEFNKYGYVVIKLLPKDVVRDLYNFYISNPNPAKAEFHATHFSTDKTYKKKVHEVIISSMSPYFQDIIPDHEPAFGNFMVKEKGGNNPMPLHADWTYVDEKNNASLAIWTPLVDTTPENGQIGVIPFSQHLSWHIRGPRIKQWEFPFNDILINEMGKILPIKAGESLIYDHRLLHFSGPNNSNTIRPAINLSLVPKGIKSLH